MTYLLDTDMVILLVRGLKPGGRRELQREAQSVLDRIKSRIAAGDSVGVSAITRAELEHGAAKCGDAAREHACLEKILTPFEAFDFTFAEAAIAYGPIRADLEALGVPIGAMDLLIAAHASALKAILVSGNTAHFGRIKGLRVENWGQSGIK